MGSRTAAKIRVLVIGGHPSVFWVIRLALWRDFDFGGPGTGRAASRLLPVGGDGDLRRATNPRNCLDFQPLQAGPDPTRVPWGLRLLKLGHRALE